jgi:hypothetical protein
MKWVFFLGLPLLGFAECKAASLTIYRSIPAQNIRKELWPTSLSLAEPERPITIFKQQKPMLPKVDFLAGGYITVLSVSRKKYI